MMHRTLIWSATLVAALVAYLWMGRKLYPRNVLWAPRTAPTPARRGR